jgi:Amt family ammonium transporter
MSPIYIGLVAGVLCAFAVNLKTKARYDDALDVVGVHLVGGLVGSLLIGLFAQPDFFDESVSTVSGFRAGYFHDGGLGLLGEQLLANGVTIVYSLTVTALIMLVLKATIGVRVTPEVESSGLDLPEHAETAYHTGSASLTGS